MGRISRSPSRPRPKLVHHAAVSRMGTKWTTHQVELWDEVARIAGSAGYKTWKRHWSHIVIAFDAAEKACDLESWLRAEKFDAPKDPGPHGPPAWYLARVESDRWLALEWAVRCDKVEAVVEAYRAGRTRTPLHFPALLVAGEAVAAAEPTFPQDRAVDVAEFVLQWVAQDDPAAFWQGIAGDHVFRR